MTAITSGSSATVTVTDGKQIAINSALTAKAYIEATSGVPGSTTKTKLAQHPGGYGVYGPFGAGTVTVYAVGGNIDYDAVDALESADAAYPVTYSPSTGSLYAGGSLVSGAWNARTAPVALTFGSGDGWTDLFGGNTISYGASNVYRSSSAMTFTPASSPQGVKRTLSPTVRIQSGAIIQIIAYLPESIADLGTPPNLQLKISSDGNSTKSFAFTFQPNKFRTGGWNVLTVKAGEDGTTDYDGTAWVTVGSEAWGNDFNYIHLSWSNLSAVPIVMDSVVIGQHDAPRVVWSFDGSDASLLTVIAPSLAQYGWSAGVFVDGNNIASNIAQLRTLRDTYGWDIGTQGMNHTNYKTTPGGGSAAQLATDLPLAYAQHAAYGLSRPTLFAYPSNAHNAATDALLASEGFTWRRSQGVDIIPLGGGATVPLASGNLVRSGYSQPLAANYTAMKNRVDGLLLSGGVLSMFTHNASTDQSKFSLGADLSHWYALIDYMGQKKRTDGLACIKPSEVTTAFSSIRRY